MPTFAVALRRRSVCSTPQRLADFVKRKASWDEVVTDANAAAPLGFFLFGASM
jgi:hypothetical protein